MARNRLQKLRDATLKELELLADDVAQTAMSNIRTPKKWFDKSRFYQDTEEITLNSVFSAIEVGGEGTITLASISQTSEYYLYSNYHTGTLSHRLHTASVQMQAKVNGIMREHIRHGTTWKRVQKSLGKANVSLGDTPKWLTELEDTALYFGRESKEVQKALKSAQRAIKKLRPDRELRRKYRGVVSLVEKGDYDKLALKEAMQKAIREKAIYNNERIARSELTRAYNDAFFRRCQDDKSITLVKHQLSSAHHIQDECTVLAEVDSFGMGAGVYPVDKCHNLPIHSNCLCMWQPIVRHIDDKKKARYSQQRTDETLKNYSPSIQKRWHKLGEPRNPHALPKELVKYD